MKDENLDVEQASESLDGIEPHDSDDPADDEMDGVRAKRSKLPTQEKRQDREGHIDP